jgi:hypothetical protein
MANLRFLSLVVIVTLLLSLFGAAPAQAGDVTIMSGNFLAQYFNNTNLSGSPALTRSDATINFSWGNGSPAPAINPDNFSARWTGTFPISTPGQYTFSVTADDGVRLWVDGALLIDQWMVQPPTTYVADVMLTAATHTFKVEYFENTGQATIAVAWGMAGSAETFSAEYFNNPNLSGSPVLTRVDATIDFNWGYGSPAPAVPVDYFSARWTTFINFPATGDYDFHLLIDDGARLYLDDVLILDRWYAQPATHHITTRHVNAGVRKITLTYFEQAQIAVARLWWEAHAPVPVGDVIVDNLDPGFTKGGPFFSAAIGYKGHMYWTRNATTTQENWGRWRPALPAPGKYEVFVHIPSNYATTRYARYTVYHAGLWKTTLVNQYIYYDAWVSLGTYAFTADGSEFVFLNDVTGEPYLARQVGFDAVKWVYVGP